MGERMDVISVGDEMCLCGDRRDRHVIDEATVTLPFAVVCMHCPCNRFTPAPPPERPSKEEP